VFISLLDNNTAKTLPRQRRIVGGIVFLCGPCHIRGKWEISSSQNFLLILGVFSVFLFCSFFYIAKPILSPFFQQQILNCTSSRNLISNSISSIFSFSRSQNSMPIKQLSFLRLCLGACKFLYDPYDRVFVHKV
jgi:hypothetical protein